MAIAAATVTVQSNTAAVIVAALNANAKAYAYSSPNSTRAVLLTNLSAKAVFLGNSDVASAANGYTLAAGQSIPISLGPADALYGIASQFSVQVAYIATS